MARRLAAILAADVVGFSRLMEVDEAGTLVALQAHRADFVEPMIASNNGRIVKLMGDGVLVEFSSVVDAVACAVAIQKGMADRNVGIASQIRIDFRIGVNLGDIIIDGDDIYGDGVNVAARLEALAEPGGVCVSGTVREHVIGKLEHEFIDGGEQIVKNLSRPIHIWHWLSGAPVSAAAPDLRSGLPLPDKPSIAVLPFSNMSGDPEQEYFSDGITEDIITELARDRGLFVIARNSSFAFKGVVVNIAEAGRRLGVRYLLEGSVRKIGNRVRVTAQLIEVASGSHIWAERYDRNIEDIFAVQDEITASIAAAIPGRIAAAIVKKSYARSPQQLDAYDLYLRGRELANRHRRDDLPRAKALFEQSIERDPGHARAHAWIADLSLQTWWLTNAAKDLEEAERFSARAVRLDNEDSFCHACRGQVLLFQRNYDGALSHFERAIALSPNDADISAMMAMFLMYTGRPQEAVRRVREAMRLNPFYPQWYAEGLGMSLMIARRYEEAAKVFSGMEEPPFYVLAGLAGCLCKLGRQQDASSYRRRMIEIKPDWTPDSFRKDPYQNADDIEHVGELMQLVAAMSD
jgi:TolB-like protein/class 3 adenylate cyclase